MHSECHVTIDAKVTKWAFKLDYASVNTLVERHLRLRWKEIVAPVTLERFVNNMVHFAMLAQLARRQKLA